FLETELAGRTGLQPVLTPGHALTSETWVQFFQTERANPRTAGAGPQLWFFPYQSGTHVEQADRDRNAPPADETLAGVEE
ncbi:MAG TPA: hypothetical protein VFV33_17845, partial [Gemmatimonadaceae bacterium]|nr:hypothetical protein [Gemmatimonadaceae bacterium]